MYSITRQSLPHGTVPPSPLIGTAHPELGASTVAGQRSPAEPAVVVCVVIAMFLRHSSSVMVGRDPHPD